MTMFDRRTLLRAELLAAGTSVLSACTGATETLIQPTDPRVADREARRRATGRTQTFRLTATRWRSAEP
ncbi:hypothetical protein QRX60_28610 [Amycolatopsis mongoliensis]|uniref:Uncharacterized protein n=1 Tax=Amycolatopsis mongoliensis TaxID=715475 RepID=A0A9Y2N9Y2_9PSEU|nr:hypothetical protein [Amycolatopsis sp. 4-36]WIX98035.1 hypothetical protein QRX60_28610 [Amycolatopsis sp. 4-36]